jgi:hypothetical protein
LDKNENFIRKMAFTEPQYGVMFSRLPPAQQPFNFLRYVLKLFRRRKASPGILRRKTAAGCGIHYIKALYPEKTVMKHPVP